MHLSVLFVCLVVGSHITNGCELGNLFFIFFYAQSRCIRQGGILNPY